MTKSLVNSLVTVERHGDKVFRVLEANPTAAGKVRLVLAEEGAPESAPRKSAISDEVKVVKPKAVKPLRIGTIVKLGQSSYRVTGNERQGSTFIARGVLVSGRGRLGTSVAFDVRKAGK